MSKITSGHVAPGFEPVAKEFERNFSERDDLGAALAVCVRGETVIDLWGGLADKGPPQRPWREDTLQLIFSGTKGLVATCVLMLVDRGLISFTDPVCKHWPEFAANGKQQITVGEVLSHRARLPGVKAPLTESDLTDDRRIAALIAAQAPDDDPRASAVYHALTFGWLCGELVRRIDGRSVGRFFAEEVARPLGLELWIGLPAAQEPRVSQIVHAADWEAGAPWTMDDFATDQLLASVYGNPPILSAGRMPWNTRAFHAAEIPGANAIGTARSVAKLYSCLACGGALEGVRIMRPETVALGREELSRFTEPLSEEPLVYGAGFQLQTERRQYYGPLDAAFGHSGAGGSVHLGWPQHGLGFSYAMNEMRDDDPAGDIRVQAPLQALFDVLEGQA